MYDFRHVSLGAQNIAAFATKQKAAHFAVQNGWRKSDCFRAYNRFCIFWAVGQLIGDEFRVLGKDGSVVSVKATISPCASPGAQ